MERTEGRQGNAVSDFKEALNKKKNTGFTKDILLLLLIGIYELFFFRTLLAADTYPGLTEDSLLVNMILEHWHDVFTGADPWNTLPSFWPAEGSLGFSDAMLIPGLIYSMVRIVIREPLDAFVPALVTMHLIGCIFACVFLRKLGGSRILCIVGLLLSLWSSSFMQIAYHTQFYNIALLPVVCYFFLLFWERRKRSFRDRLPYGIVATLVYGGVWLSSFYTAYFFSLFFGGVVVFSVLAFRIRQRKAGEKVQGKKMVSVIAEGAFYAVLQVLWVIPFLLIYLPAYSQKGEYEPGFVLTHAPDLWDIFRTRSYAPVSHMLQNRLPISVPQEYDIFLENRRMELSCGWGWLIVLLFLGSFVFYIVKGKKEKTNEEYHWFCVAGGISVITLFLCSCRYGSFFPWEYLRFVLPGADTIRVTGRCMGVLLYPVSVMICLALAEIVKSTLLNVRWKKGIMITLMIMLVWEGQSEIFCNREIGQIRAELENVSVPPQDCRAFFMCPQSLEANQSFRMNMMGWLIADRYSVKTINGYSGSFPEGWYLITDDIGQYYGNLIVWMNDKAISGEGIYGYVYESDTWLSVQQIFF